MDNLWFWKHHVLTQCVVAQMDLLSKMVQNWIISAYTMKDFFYKKNIAYVNNPSIAKESNKIQLLVSLEESIDS